MLHAPKHMQCSKQSHAVLRGGSKTQSYHMLNDGNAPLLLGSARVGQQGDQSRRQEVEQPGVVLHGPTQSCCRVVSSLWSIHDTKVEKNFPYMLCATRKAKSCSEFDTSWKHHFSTPYCLASPCEIMRNLSKHKFILTITYVPNNYKRQKMQLT